MAQHQVRVEKMTFDPNVVRAHVGDTVTWNWNSDTHSVTSDNNTWPDTGVQNTGFTFSHVFNATGSFSYHCSVHGGPGGQGMHGTVRVLP